jgi:threonine/homoserine efflux transporter RhtA
VVRVVPLLKESSLPALICVDCSSLLLLLSYKPWHNFVRAETSSCLNAYLFALADLSLHFVFNLVLAKASTKAH